MGPRRFLDLDDPLGRQGALLILSYISVLFYGYFYFPQSNLNQIIPFINKITNSSLYPSDSYIETLRSYPSLYPYLMSWAGRLIALPPFYFLLHLAAKWLLLSVVFKLTDHLFDSTRANWIACVLFALSPLINSSSILGDDPLIKPLLYQSSLAGPIALWALSLFIRKKFSGAFAAAAMAYYLNGMIANFALILMAFATPRAEKSVWKGWGIFALLWLPWLFWYLRLPNLYGGPSPDFIALLKAWYPGHYFPSTWSWEKWSNAAGFLCLFAFLFASGMKACRGRREIQAFLAAFPIMWMAAALFGEIIPTSRIAVLQFFRSDIFFLSLAMIFGANYLARLQEPYSLEALGSLGLLGIALTRNLPLYFPFQVLLLLALPKSRFPMLRKVLIMGLLCVHIPFYSQWPLIALCFLLGIIPWESDPQARLLLAQLSPLLLGLLFLAPSIAVPLFGLVLASCRGSSAWRKIAVMAFAAFCFINSDPNAPINIGSASAFFFLGLLLLSEPGDALPRLSPNLIYAALAVLIFYQVPRTVLSRHIMGRIITEGPELVDWEDLQRWARKNTSVKSLFIVPPYWNGFRDFSERSCYVDWNDGAAMHWAPGYEILWRRRLSKLGFSTLDSIADLRFPNTSTLGNARSKDRYAQLTGRNLRNVVDEAGADYLVEDNDQDNGYPLAYANATFRLYKTARSAPRK